jgi:4-amino-4-deoxychorismate lyase
MKPEFLETIRIKDAQIYNLEYHQERYAKVLYSYNKKPYARLADYIKAPSQGLYRCRLLYNTDRIVDVSYSPYVKRDTTTLKLLQSSIKYDKKFADRAELESLFSKRGLCDDVLIVQNGYITDTTIANIALLKNGVWYTPKKVLLEGTTRQRLLREGRIVEKEITLKELYKYEAVALMNAMIDFDIIRNKTIEDIIC